MDVQIQELKAKMSNQESKRVKVEVAQIEHKQEYILHANK